MRLIKRKPRRNICQRLTQVFSLYLALSIISIALAKPVKPFIDTLPFLVPTGDTLEHVFVDSRDMLWLNTGGYSLYRYDGVDSSTSVKKNLYVPQLDGHDRVWSSHSDNAHIRLGFSELKTGKSTDVLLQDEAGERLELVDGLYALTWNDSEMWLLTKKGQLYRTSLADAKPKTLVFHKFGQLPVATSPFYNNELTLDDLGRVWFAQMNHLIRIEPKTGQQTDFSRYIKSVGNINWGVSTAISKSGDTFVGITVSNTLLHIDPTDKVTQVSIGYRIHEIQSDPLRGIIWIATTNGLYYNTENDLNFQHYGPEPWQEAGVPSPTIRRVSLDKHNNLWLTSNKGFYVMRAMHNNVQRIIPETFRSNRPPDAGLQVILGLGKQDENTLWWFNRRQELVRYQIDSGKERVFPIVFQDATQFDEARSMAISPPYILLTTHTGGLLRFDMRSERFVSPLSAQSFGGKQDNSHNFLSNQPDRNNRLWFGGLERAGDRIRLYYWDVHAQKAQALECRITNPEVNSDSTVNAFFYLAQYQDTLWLANRSKVGAMNNLLKVSLSNKLCSHFRLPIKFDITYAVEQQDNFSLWLVQDNRIRRIALNDGTVLFDEPVPLSTIGQVQRDESGNFLISGNGALWKFIISTQTWIPLFVSEINLDSMTWMQSYFDRKAKVFYLATHQGILAVDIQKSLALGSPHVAFTTIKTGSSAVQSLYDGLPLLSIPYGEVVEINFVALPQMPSNLQRFRYRLNKDQPWIYREDNTRLLFSQLPPGDVTLEMQATFTYKEFGNSQFLSFTVEPPWWRTYPAYVAYALIIAAILAGLLHWLRTRDRLRQAALTLSVFENISEGLCVLSNDYRIVRINSTMSTMLGWQIGENARKYLVHVDTIQTAFRVSLQATETHPLQRWQTEAYLTNAQGTQFIAELRLEILSGLRSEGRLLVVAEDITERKLHEQRLQHLSRYDHLTDIPNRLYFNEHLDALLPRSSHLDRYALVLADLDDFKTINDSHGHNVGDQLLKVVAGELLEQLATVPEPGAQNIVARHSGDEFLILVKVSKAFELAFEDWLKKTQARLARSRIIDNVQVRVKASMGISFYPDNTNDGQMLLQQADMAMYQAKKRDKGGYAYFSEKLDIELKRMVELENAILYQQGYFGLEVFYQPKICLNTGLCRSAEALSRWRLASGELLQPGQWLPLIRPGEMEKQLHLAILRQVCLDLPKFQTIHANFSVSINVSPLQLEMPDYLPQLLTIIDAANINHQLVTLEVLEDAGISNVTVLENLRLIREQGFKISIDDFGTGYSSLSHLNQLMAHELKIDRYFLNGIPDDATAKKLYLNIIELAKRFELSIVAEGVETPEQLQFIKQHGCHHYQGYLYSPPVPTNHFIELLTRSTQ